MDVESVLSEKGSDSSVKTTVHIQRLFEKFGFDEVFGRSAADVSSCLYVSEHPAENKYIEFYGVSEGKKRMDGV